MSCSRHSRDAEKMFFGGELCRVLTMDIAVYEKAREAKKEAPVFTSVTSQAVADTPVSFALHGTDDTL